MLSHMNSKSGRSIFSFLKLQTQLELTKHLHQHNQCRGIAKVRLKWVQNRALDHIIDGETDLKAACLLKDAIKRSSTGFLTAKSFADWQKPLGLTVPVLRFIRRYPTLFHEFPHARYSSLPCFRLTDTALLLDSQEQAIHDNHEADTVERLCRVLMMMKTRSLPFQSVVPFKWDLGLPDNFMKTLIPKYPDHFQVVNSTNGGTGTCLRLAQWRDEFAVSALQRSHESGDAADEYRQFKSGQMALNFAMNFPKGYGAQKKVRAWMEEFQKLPYISPYEDSRLIDPSSDLMEKRAVGVLHELLSLTIHKKTKRNYVRKLREELNLPHKFTRLFTRYPGIFYLSLKCKTTTIALKEGYRRGKLVDPHPLVRHRVKFTHVMRTGLLYRSKGIDILAHQDFMLNDGRGEESQEEDYKTGDECSEEIDESELDRESDEE